MRWMMQAFQMFLPSDYCLNLALKMLASVADWPRHRIAQSAIVGMLSESQEAWF